MGISVRISPTSGAGQPEFWSNAAYAVGGLILLFAGHVLPALGMIGLAVGSGYYHLTHTPRGLVADRLGMYILCVILMYDLGMFPPVIAGLVALAMIPAAVFVPSEWALGALMGLPLGYGFETLWPYVLAFLAAVGLNKLAAQRPFTSWHYDVLHAVWHFITAALYTHLFLHI